MTKHRKKSQQSSTSLHEFVTVAFAEDMELAKQYKKILNESDIPVIIRDTHESAQAPGIAVMVSEDHLDEAHVLIESQSSHESFYDLELGDDFGEGIASGDDFDEDDEFYSDI
jgi:hypothetical protein